MVERQVQMPHLVEVDRLTVDYGSSARGGGSVRAVDGVGFSISPGETLTLVGESGSGKSSVGLAILGLVAARGSVRVGGEQVVGSSSRTLRRARTHMQVIFQDPYASLNPMLSVRQIVGEPIRARRLASGRKADEIIRDLVTKVGLDAGSLRRRASQLSGGQRQRVAIARALAGQAEFIVCDEPTSALDVTVQSQILDLLLRIQAETNISLLFITHNLGVAKQLGGSIAVMYRGSILEYGPASDVVESPRSPYTALLLKSVMSPEVPADSSVPFSERQNPVKTTEGLVLHDDVPGCPFYNRCVFANERCQREVPGLQLVSEGHRVACHHWRELPMDLRKAPMVDEVHPGCVQDCSGVET